MRLIQVDVVEIRLLLSLLLARGTMKWLRCLLEAGQGSLLLIIPVVGCVRHLLRLRLRKCLRLLRLVLAIVLRRLSSLLMLKAIAHLGSLLLLL